MALNEVRLLLEQAGAQADDPGRWRTALAGLQGAEKAFDERANVAVGRELAELKRIIMAGDKAARRDQVLLAAIPTYARASRTLGPRRPMPRTPRLLSRPSSTLSQPRSSSSQQN